MTAALWLLLGLACGIAHFALLQRNVHLYLNAGGMTRAIGLQMLRLVTMAAVLVFAAWHGALPLLAAALGAVLSRSLVLHMMRAAP